MYKPETNYFYISSKEKKNRNLHIEIQLDGVTKAAGLGYGNQKE